MTPPQHKNRSSRLTRRIFYSTKALISNCLVLQLTGRMVYVSGWQGVC